MEILIFSPSVLVFSLVSLCSSVNSLIQIIIPPTIVVPSSQALSIETIIIKILKLKSINRWNRLSQCRKSSSSAAYALHDTQRESKAGPMSRLNGWKINFLRASRCKLANNNYEKIIYGDW